ncbi:hypothetical protein GCK32_019145 [Trichostrongylus colubriformis]|uniref:Uncharacterized protein n=1 Tax=Trichostrongylus colubriformis TaxID=6319 RepID=A0AAN8J1C2_TRICO
MLRRLGHAYEIYPFIFLNAYIIVAIIVTGVYSFFKIEVWFDRSRGKLHPPWEWERAKDNYWKQPCVFFDFNGVTRKRCELMEVLQDEMVAAAKKRGTR